MQYPLVSTAWLEANLFEADVIVLDASMDNVIGKTPIVYDKFIAIPRAQKIDLETVFCDTSATQVHAMPSVEQFNQGIANLGIDSDSTVVIYDNQGIYSSPRAWWMFKVMGFERVFVLDGGLPQWLLEGRMTAELYHQHQRQGHFKGQYQAGLVCDMAYVLARFDADNAHVFDARAASRFNGEVAEPRPNVRRGHIPGSINLPFSEVLDGHKLQATPVLQALFAQQDGGDNIERIFTCGSGITACILILAAVASGCSKTLLYDGSWSEWGRHHHLPISPCEPGVSPDA